MQLIILHLLFDLDHAAHSLDHLHYAQCNLPVQLPRLFPVLIKHVLLVVTVLMLLQLLLQGMDVLRGL